MNPKSEFYATICWDELIVNGKVAAPAGEYTIYRPKLEWIIESVQEYLGQWKNRGAYLETVAEEYDDPNSYISRFIDHTEDVKSQLKGSK
tara:strand:+ start:322 stop:591 length:270 start_codon:yes stop_codon:yes gene_type:complete